MATATTQRRDEIEHYFDRTAAQAWSRLTSDAPVSGIRATVRAGRDRMRQTLLGFLPIGSARLPAARCRLRHRCPCGRGRTGAAPT